jgi:hypothetical protein
MLAPSTAEGTTYMHKKIGLAVTFGFVLASTMVYSGVAHAEEGDGVLEALTDVTAQSESAATRVLDDVAGVPTDNDGDSAIDSPVQGAEVVVPTTASEPIDLSIPGSNAGMKITLPFEDQASPAEALAPGIVAFDNNNDTSTAAVVKDDGSLVIATVIESVDAPDRYSYTIEGAPGSSLQAQPDGTVFLLDAENANILGGFLPPWARDAAGNDVPTRYEVSGNELTQIVDLNSPGIVFPVVADPQAGYTLLEGVWKNRPGGYVYKNGAQWSTRLSVWGATVWTSGLVGHQTVKTQGWVEWKNGVAPEMTTVHEQFDCHAVFGYAIWQAGIWWDFETARASHPNWFTDPQNCNWA